jgi:hypothetical protein
VDKLSKAEAGYIYAPGSELHCSECAFISKQGTCTDYVAKDEDVKSYGGCNDWKDLKNGRIEGNHDKTRIETGYVENKPGFGCRRCEELEVGSEDCKRVDKKTEGATPGKIDVMGCCNLWDADSKRSKMTTPALVQLIAQGRPAGSVMHVKRH